MKIPDNILMNVEKPTRYTGGELNEIIKEAGTVDIRFAFCFPDTYEIGMSCLGMKILYSLINTRTDAWCERVFAPWPDMEQKMRENSIPLYGLESKDALNKFDMLGFTLQYEMCYTNVLNMLDLAGIPKTAKERSLLADTGEHVPFVIAGGPCTCNPEPVADFIDAFVLGEGEDVINEILDIYSIWKKDKKAREEFLIRLAGLEGVYVPSFYMPVYNADGTISKMQAASDNYPGKVKKRLIKDINDIYYPDNMIVPYGDIVHDRIMLELFRGCSRGCRFCQAGFIYRPVRERNSKMLADIAGKLVDNTGYEEVSMVSLSTSDYSDIGKLTDKLLGGLEPKKVNLALPSLRVDSFSLKLMNKVKTVRKSGLTFAPEAGTQRLRDIINKNVTTEDLINSTGLAFSGGWNRIKLYFMVGLPFETEEDIKGISELADMVIDVWNNVIKARATDGKGKFTPARKKRKLKLNISTSCFIPKPFTPFQWEAQSTMDQLNAKQAMLRGLLKDARIEYNWHDPALSFLEAVFARGDRRVGTVLQKAWEKGCKFDGWNELMKFDMWNEAFSETGVDPAFYANRKRSFDEVLPWDHLDYGVSKEYLIKECKAAETGEQTPDCRSKCSGCGVNVFAGGICCG